MRISSSSNPVDQDQDEDEDVDDGPNIVKASSPVKDEQFRGDEDDEDTGDDSPVENDLQFKLAISTASSLQTQLREAHHQIETLLVRAWRGARSEATKRYE